MELPELVSKVEALEKLVKDLQGIVNQHTVDMIGFNGKLVLINRDINIIKDEVFID